ncbi:unnamed protein product [Didymodactylos carnosus]|nr:unnamed protein product [Didymodactylos carnosus]CAF3895882.1 unnamed protein product [Didymodactylos carnosus]
MPACLPGTCDYIPSMEEINREYSQNLYTLIYTLSPKRRLGPNDTTTDGLKDTTWRLRKVILDELVDQRLSQGFQMVSVMPEIFKGKMEDSITQSGYKRLGLDFFLSMGRIYHTISLVTSENSTEDTVEIYVQQHKPQHPNLAKCMEYKYRFQAPDSSLYDSAIFELKPENLEQYPWNSVDNVVCTHGTGDNQLLETMKYWRTRLVVMPASRDYTPKMVESGVIKCDSRPELTPEQFYQYIEHFTRFLLMLNKLKYVSPERVYRTLFTKGIIRHCTGQEKYYRFGFFLYYIVTDKTKDFHLEANDYAEVEYFKVHEYIPSMDFEGFADRKLMRLLPKIIMNDNKTKSTTQTNYSSDQQFDRVIQSYNLISTSLSSRILPPSISSDLPNLRRNCNVDVDPLNKSDRTEWATAQYHSYYNPHCLFELEIRWLVATACILSDLIGSWAVRTQTGIGEAQVAFHLVPVPCDPFAEFDPLRGPIYIRLNVECLKERLSDLTENDQIVKMSIFQELILKRYGFILNACVCNSDDSIYYVHISGGMLVYIISDVYNVHKIPSRLVSTAETVPTARSDKKVKMDIGFCWCWNFCLGRRWRTINTGDERYQDKMLADFRSFCRNDDNRMVLFWDEAYEKATKIKAFNRDL